MNYKSVFKEKLSKLLFLEIDREGFKRNLNIPKEVKFKGKDLYIPISSEYIASTVANEIKINNLPVYNFIEGMYIALGADENLSYNEDYIIILNNIKESEECGKDLVAKRIKEGKLEDAYLILRGMFLSTGNEEYIKKLLLVGEAIREKDKGFKEILLEDCDRAIEEFAKMPEPYLYKAIISKEEGDFGKARVEINEYINRGGEVTDEIKVIMNDIEHIATYEKAIELLDESPEKSIGMLLSLVEIFDSNPLLYYYLAVAYRKIENYEKAIYYLNESIAIESGILEVVNEFGINYACLGNYEEAIKYFKKAFEASRDIEICTNIIMCYINMGDKEQAKLHLDIAKKINPEDEIVKQLEKMI